ncbi:SMP-30/gluconolactonase/LRE family protein [Dankookia sp. P2]|uniref:SMP-30/gluconolactonase/LRE family protein n=1 Tax=Dankookia sp. P2 TaxID=3423955 RepID=UPI003D66A4B2
MPCSAASPARSPPAPPSRRARSSATHGRGGAPTRYPDADIVTLDKKRFTAPLGNSTIRRLYTGLGWAEGPAWHATGRFWIWSDIPNDECLRMNEEDHSVHRRFRSPSGFSNGNTFDREGRQIACRHFHRDVVRYEPDGRLTVLAARGPDGALNAPNDAVVHPADGAIWFTDPGYGALMNYEGNRVPEAANSPRPFIKEAVYRIDAQSGQVTKVTDQPFQAERALLLARLQEALCRRQRHEPLPRGQGRHLGLRRGRPEARHRQAAVQHGDGREVGLRRRRALRRVGQPRGSAPAGSARAMTGCTVFAPDGQRIGLIKLPEICANLCFGGTRRNQAADGREPEHLLAAGGDPRRAFLLTGCAGRAAPVQRRLRPADRR